MKKRMKTRLIICVILLVMLTALLPFTALAATDESYFTFDTATGTITGYDIAGGTDVDIPSTIGGTAVTAIGAHAFENMLTLTSIIIPEGVVSIGDNAFYGCDQITSMTLPGSLETIGEYAFLSCSLYYGVTLPDGLIGLGEGAFCGCYNLRAITIPSGITEIADYTFSNCDALGLGNVTFSGDITRIGDYAFQGCHMSSGITLPECLVSIGEGAFRGCGGLSSVIIPDTVNYIGIKAFEGCWQLQNVTLPTGLSAIGESFFGGCWNLKSITLPDSVTSIGPGAFDSSGLERIILPTGVSSIGEDAFRGCSSLTEISIPSDVTSIGDNAFNGCTLLAGITLPSGITSIGEGTFVNCSSLHSLTIPDSVTGIGSFAFIQSGLHSLTIPAGVTNLGGDMFYNCSGLTSVYFQGDAPTVETSYYGFFQGTPSDLKVYYPYGASGWSNPWQGREAVALCFSVSGGVLGTDYTYTDHTLTFLQPGNYEMAMSGGMTDTDKIVVNATGSSAASPVNITLNNVGIELSDSSALSVQNGSTVALALSGTNILQSGAGYAGLRVTGGNSLTISGSGTLTVTGGTQGAGIGGGNGEDSGDVALTGGVVFAQGGSGAQDIGAGDGGTVTGTLNLSGTAALFLYNDDIIAPTTITHTHVDVDDTADDMYGISNTPGWAAGFGAFLRIYTLSFDANGGTGTLPEAYTALYGWEVTIPDGSELSRTGYTFAGWNTQENGSGTPYAADSIFTYNQTTTLYAQWTPIDYTIDYDLDGGSVSSANPTSYTVESGAITLNNPTKAGYVFTGWSGMGISGTSMRMTIPHGSTGDRAYTAHWTAAYTITYNLDGGTVSPTNPASYTAESGDILLNNPTKTGHVFTGWSGTGISGTSMNVMIPQGSTGDREYTAHWTAIPPDTYTVNFDSQGGSAVVSQTGLSSGALVAKPADPARSGYTFGGWYKEPACVNAWNFAADTVTDNITLYAKWTQDTPGLDDDIPKTGDNSSNLIWWLLCSVSAAGIAALTVWHKKQSLRK